MAANGYTMEAIPFSVQPNVAYPLTDFFTPEATTDIEDSPGIDLTQPAWSFVGIISGITAPSSADQSAAGYSLGGVAPGSLQYFTYDGSAPGNAVNNPVPLENVTITFSSAFLAANPTFNLSDLLGSDIPGVQDQFYNPNYAVQGVTGSGYENSYNAIPIDWSHGTITAANSTPAPPPVIPPTTPTPPPPTLTPLPPGPPPTFPLNPQTPETISASITNTATAFTKLLTDIAISDGLDLINPAVAAGIKEASDILSTGLKFIASVSGGIAVVNDVGRLFNDASAGSNSTVTDVQADVGVLAVDVGKLSGPAVGPAVGELFGALAGGLLGEVIPLPGTGPIGAAAGAEIGSAVGAAIGAPLAGTIGGALGKGAANIGLGIYNLGHYGSLTPPPNT